MNFAIGAYERLLSMQAENIAATDDFDIGIRAVCEEIGRRRLTEAGIVLFADELERAISFCQGAASSRSYEPAKCVMIAGLPRTGTTFLHGLMSAGAHAWAPRLCDIMWPYLNPSAARRRTAWQCDFLSSTSPGYVGTHPFAVDEPAECINAMMLGGMCALWDLFWDLPESLSRLVSTARIFELPHHLSMISHQMDSAGKSGRIAYLKSPYHSLWLESLLLSPSLKVVFVRRSYDDVEASWARLLNRAQEGLLIDRDAISQHSRWRSIWTGALENLEDAASSGLALALPFSQLVNDPLSVAAAVAEFAGEEPGLAKESLIARRNWLDRQSSEKRMPI
jgi:Sulfotransferase family